MAKTQGAAPDAANENAEAEKDPVTGSPLRDELTRANAEYRSLLEAYNALKAELESVSDHRDKLRTENDELEERLALLSKTPETQGAVLPEDSFEHEGKRYRFVTAKFRYEGQVVTAIDALTDAQLLEKLIKSESGLIREVV